MPVHKKVKISVSQLFVMLFISRTIVNITYSVYVADTTQLYDHLFSSLCAFFLTLLMTVPIYLLYKKNNEHSILDCGYNSLGKAGAVIAVVYAIYFLWVLCYTLSLFDLFVTDLMNPKISAVALSLGVMAASIYGAYKGIEALARTSGLVFIAILAAGVFLVCALFAQIDPMNFTPMFYNGYQGIVDGVLLMLARNSCIPAMAVLLPMTQKGNVKKGIFWWCFGVYATTALIIFLVTGVMGDYVRTQPFPVYTATSVAEIGIFQRMDAVFLGVWTAGIFIKSALFIYLVSLCIKKIWGERAGRISVIVTGTVVLLITFGIIASQTVMEILFNNYILLLLTVLTGVILPLFLLLKKKGRGKP